jgi:hypothetical protein
LKQSPSAAVTPWLEWQSSRLHSKKPSWPKIGLHFILSYYC